MRPRHARYRCMSFAVRVWPWFASPSALLLGARGRAACGSGPHRGRFRAATARSNSGPRGGARQARRKGEGPALRGARREERHSNNGIDLLAALAGKLAGEPTDRYLNERLFRPMGIADVDWVRDKKGVPLGAGEMLIRPLDLAKFDGANESAGHATGTTCTQRHLPSSSIACPIGGLAASCSTCQSAARESRRASASQDRASCGSTT